MQTGGGEEGKGCVRAVTDAPASATEQPSEVETQDEGQMTVWSSQAMSRLIC
jgi:hypothetical protein